MEEPYEGFVVNGVKLKKSLDSIQQEVALSVGSQLVATEFHVSDEERSFTFAFEKPQKESVISQLFPDCDVIPVPEFSDRISRHNPIYVTDIVEEYNDKKKFEELASTFGQMNGSSISAKGIYIIQFVKDFQATSFTHFLPRIKFATGKFRVFLDPDAVPLIHIKQIPVEFTPKQMVEFIENEDIDVLQSYVQPKDEVYYSMNILLKSNEDAYHVIDTLNYSKIQNEELLFTHFKTNDQIMAMKEWELKVSGIKHNATLCDLSEFFKQYGRVFSVHINRSPLYARIVFDRKQDAETARDTYAVPDSPLTVTFPTDKTYKTVFVNNLPHYIKNNEIKKLFPKALTIVIKPNKIWKELPPTVVLTFHKEAEGVEAVQKGNTTFVRSLKLFCMPFIGKDRIVLEKVGIAANLESTIFIKNLKGNVKFEEIVGLCAEFGTMDRVTLQSKKGRKDAAAIVQFTEKKMAAKAIEEISEFNMDGWVPQASYFQDPQAKIIEQAKKVREMNKGVTHPQSTEKDDEIDDDNDNDQEEDCIYGG